MNIKQNVSNIGQITNRSMLVSNCANYLQLDICGLSSTQALDKLLKYKEKNPKLKKIILHADWTKKGFSENNIRWKDYIEIIKNINSEIKILGITIHPPYRRKLPFEEFLKYCDEIDNYSSVFIENRSNKDIYLSKAEEIINFSFEHKMTIDIPQLYISCKYNIDRFLEVLNKINHNNVCEYHLGNIVKQDKHTYVARRLSDKNGILDYEIIKKYLRKDAYFTLEILGGCKVFKEESLYYKYL